MVESAPDAGAHLRLVLPENLPLHALPNTHARSDEKAPRLNVLVEKHIPRGAAQNLPEVLSQQCVGSVNSLAIGELHTPCRLSVKLIVGNFSPKYPLRVSCHACTHRLSHKQQLYLIST